MAKKLTFETARAKFTKISKGEYRNMEYELNENDGVSQVKCTLYLHGYSDRYSGETWEEAFKLLGKAMYPKKDQPANLDQAPNVSIK